MDKNNMDKSAVARLHVTRRTVLEVGSAAAAASLVGRPQLALADTEMPAPSVTVGLQVNGDRYALQLDPRTTLLDALREHLGLTGTKFSCGIAQCGACTLHIDGQPVRSCSVPVSAAAGKAVTTIEGLSPDGTHPVQLAWIDLDVPQGGYCQSGMIMSVAALLNKGRNPTDAEIDAEVTNACRCSTYHRIRKAIHLAASRMPT